MSDSLGAGRKTIRTYIAVGIVPGRSPKSEGEWHELARE
jgi:hypothetical protein